VPRTTLFLCSAVCCVLCLSGPISAAQYSIVEVPQLTHAAGLNDNGDVVGDTSPNNNVSATSYAFYLHRRGVVNQLPDAFYLGGINDSGQIVGTEVAGLPQVTVWYVSGGELDLGQSGLSEGQAINNSGLVVGTTGDFHGNAHAALWRGKDKSLTELGTLIVNDPHQFDPYPQSDAAAINAKGHVVGSSDVIFFDAAGIPTGVGTHAFRWEAGVMKDLGALPGSTFSAATGINDHDDVVGFSALQTGANHAFLYHDGKMVDLKNLANDPRLASEADGISDRGEIVGWSEVRLTATNAIAQRAFVYSWGRMWNLQFQIDPKSPLYGHVRLTEAVAINCNGWIVANGYDAHTLKSHAYLLMLQVAHRKECPYPR
jgi:probable HAF family extracellular repeat protein